MCIRNCDDHFRNNGFLFVDNKLEMSPIYDINPNPDSDHLSLNIDESSSFISNETILNSAKFYDLSIKEALTIINNIKNIIKENYKKLAKKNGISDNEIKI